MRSNDDINPEAARRRLAKAVATLHDQRGPSHTELSKVLNVSVPQVSRLLNGERGFSDSQLVTLAGLYNVGPREHQHWLELAAESRRRAWWQQAGLPPDLRRLISLEQEATSIFEFNAGRIPGLLQTWDYAQMMARTSSPSSSESEVASTAEALLRRAWALFDKSRFRERVEYWAVVDEGVLARMAHGSEMRYALRSLHEASHRPSINLQVVPFSAGPAAGSHDSFTLLEIEDSLVGYLPSATGGRVTTDAEENKYLATIRDSLQRVALSPRDSLDLIAYYAIQFR